MSQQFDIEFHASGRGKAQCPPDPAYPHGVAFDCAPGASAWCIAHLPYPAPECGHFLVACRLCSFKVAVTAAGRPDDPISVRMPCQMDADEIKWIDAAVERAERAKQKGITVLFRNTDNGAIVTNADKADMVNALSSSLDDEEDNA